MKSLFFILLLLLSISNTYSYQVEGTIENISPGVSILEGESFNAKINIWPMTDESLDEIKSSLQGKMFLDYFYIAQVQRIEFSENNSDVVVAIVKVVLTKAYDGKSVFIWTYKSLTVPFEIKKIIPIKNTLEKDFIILNQKNGFLSGKFNYITYGVGVVILILLGIGLNKSSIRRKEKKKHTEIILNWKNIFLLVNDREGVEEIYRRRNEWLLLVGGETPPIRSFFEELNNIQYKKEWTDIEEHKVLEAYDEIRGIF